MASSNENVSMALFCDFENVALGVRDANYDKFDIKPVLERLLLKGSIVVKKAYCDWDRYKSFKASMHEANFELIEIPHVRQSGKNSADIRMVVDALDLCYTKSHVDTFVIISGDSDFSPLVSKLRENAKKVIGVGVKQSTSDLLVANCDEFIFYDDLVRESRRARRETSNDKPQVKRTPEEERARRDEMEKRRNQAVEIAVNTFEALVLERGDSGKIWASVLKEAIKRRKPDFSESYYGFRTFGNLIEECKARGHLEFGRDEKSGAYVYRGSGVPQAASEAPAAADGAAPAASATPADGASQESRRSRNRGRTAAERFAERQAQRLSQHQRPAHGAADGAPAQPAPAEAGPVDAAPVDTAPVVLEAAVELPVQAASTEASAPAKKKNGAKPPARKMKDAAKKGKPEAPATAEAVAPAVVVEPTAPAPAPVETVVAEAVPVADKPAKAAKGKSQAKPQAKPKAKPAADKPARKPAAPRAPRPPKAVAPAEE
ncbi:TIGR00288 family protein [Duganella sacchari]|uniref:TIGR00288 family protein n=1 Tax=Duganella sacchari TaxID=551987 RepID=A0A1M7QV13_9BURK|nr:NYN domain-containing protein [Duganella sacchari]SHN35700.1 TIGR00288 family protein [Duganella sacchari]